jgi:hypothetical protein
MGKQRDANMASDGDGNVESDGKLDGLERALEAGTMNADEILKDLNLVIKLCKGSKKTHCGRDMTNLNRALEIKAKIYGIMKGESAVGNAKIEEIDEDIKEQARRLSPAIFSGLLNGGGEGDCQMCEYKLEHDSRLRTEMDAAKQRQEVIENKKGVDEIEAAKMRDIPMILM